jgi:predicted DNA-binding transcriptional regulator YafY
MSRLNKTGEIIQLAMLLQNSYKGLCIDDIQEYFECSRRSAERMKALLLELFPDKVEEVQTDDKKKRWRFIKGGMNPYISFTVEDFATLELLKGLTTDDGQAQRVEEVISKVKALTPQKNLRALDTDVSAILESEGFAVRQYSRIKPDSSVLEKLRNAMLAFKKVKFQYPVNKEIKNITLDPYGIVISEKYYLVGYNEYVDDLRLYLIDKIDDLEVLEEYFEKDEEFSLKKYCENSFGVYQEEPINIILEFDKEISDEVMNYHFHPTQKIKKLENGNVQVKLYTGGQRQICFELFKWGTKVQIKKPEELKTHYKEYLTKILTTL